VQFVLVAGQDDCNKAVRTNLTQTVVDRLIMLLKERDLKLSPEDTDLALKHAFLAIDDNIVHTPADNALSNVPTEEPVLELHDSESSTSVVHAFYDNNSRMLHVSNVGECRAILGRPTNKGLFDVYQMSHEHTLNNTSERYKLQKEHPGETLKELSTFMRLTRSFGMGHLKWSQETREELYSRRLAQPPLSHAKSPPYVTAEPEIIRRKVQPGDFLILGDPGIWDSLTSEEAVGLVGLWLKQHTAGIQSQSAPIAVKPAQLPVTLGQDQTKAYQRWGAPKEFIIKDETPALVLARNVLGGRDDLLAYRLTRGHPLPAAWRKDIKCAVILFE
jgi:pyruvate dehydrogenase phosphatase